MCRPTEALLYWKLASNLNALRRAGAAFRDVVDARDDLEGLAVCADHGRIRTACLKILDSVGPFGTSATPAVPHPQFYDWPAWNDLPPVDWRRPDALA